MIGRPVSIYRPADKLSMSKPVLEALPLGGLVGVVQIKGAVTSNRKLVLPGRPVDSQLCEGLSYESVH
jgi:hypothetical protein